MLIPYLRLAASLLGLTTTPAAHAEVAYAGPTEVGRLTAPPRNETSGIAASRRGGEILWVHDDSGGEAALYAVGTDGKLRGKLQLSGLKNKDWEDLASVHLDGKSWLVISDTGDNDEERRSVALHFVEEPASTALGAGKAIAATPTASIEITYEDGARDAEALAIDAEERTAYLLTKRDPVPRLYRVALPSTPLKSTHVQARFVGFVPDLARQTIADVLRSGTSQKHRARPCAMDFAPDGSAVVVLTYSEVLLFTRRSGEPWAEAFARDPVRLGEHGLPQAEAVCFSRDGTSIYVASESVRTLLRFSRVSK